MQADEVQLPLPHGAHSARYVEGMRVVTAYSAAHDALIVRFDTIIDGEQRALGYELRDASQSFVDTLSGRAKQRFLAGEGQWERGVPLLFEPVSA